MNTYNESGNHNAMIFKSKVSALSDNFIAEDDRASQVERMQSYYNAMFFDFDSAKDDIKGA